MGFGWLVPCPVPGGLLSSCGWLNQGFDVQDSSERAVPADGPTGTPDVRLWGKHRELPGPYPVVCHLLDTAAMAGALFDEWFGAAAAGRLASSLGVEPGAVRAMVMFWAGLHDIGKVTPPFQAKVPDLYKALIGDPDYATVSLTENERGFGHDEATMWVLAEVLPQLGYAAGRSGLGHVVAQLLGAHHGRVHRSLDHDDLRRPRACKGAAMGWGGWERQAFVHAAVLRAVIGGGAQSVLAGPVPSAVVPPLAGLVVVADWLASQKEFIIARMPGHGWGATIPELQAHFDEAVLDAPAVVAEAGLARARFRDMPTPAEFPQRFGFVPNQLQASLMQGLARQVNGPGMLLITAPPGDGKTEAAQLAALRFAQVAEVGGMVFALPTMATTDAMFTRLAQFCGDEHLLNSASIALVHGMSWLNSDFAKLAAGSVSPNIVVSDARAVAFSSEWLRGGRRGLLAAIGALTIDQILAGVLPMRHNLLRLSALTGKVVVIDEAHSYGPWMHALLLRLLTWLGAMRVPVVVMSATLSGRIAHSVVEAYRRGVLGPGASALEPVAAPYPGWLFVDGDTGEVGAPVTVGSGRRHQLQVELIPVTRAQDSAGERDRLAVIADRVADVAGAEGGCVLVCCNTVAEAQETLDYLDDFFNSEDGSERVTVRLLHSRFQALDRSKITDAIQLDFGKPGNGGERPVRAVVVATQVVEQSIDLDFDLVISDLAPVALLFQRAGRCQRHRRGKRPVWIGDQPRLVVLDPVKPDGEYELPRQWGSVYYDSLLRRTRNLLAQQAEAPIRVPEDVQAMVDGVYADEFAQPGNLTGEEGVDQWRADLEYHGAVLAETQLAENVIIDEPRRKLTNLHAGLWKTDGSVDDDLIVTRLGADSARVVLVFQQGDGRQSLDAEGKAALAQPLTGEGVRTLMEHTIPVPGSWAVGHASALQIPAAWETNPLLRHIALIQGRAGADGRWHADDGSLTYDQVTGLRHA
ncbi:CRISPR-associated helicase/endonuclease Cas3 [Catenulispora yoronensis]|uniref:CRISPR-associated helicase/endonuclease Cas3 n=1 Tax=Catenulispora yoronensis TaxID=450799 RepID=A0ABN2VB96_9ACTN